jgi:hypothetical protein
MKKIILTIALAVGMVVSASAQKAGEQAFGFNFGYETTKSSVKMTAGSESLTETSPSENTFNVGVEYNRFVKDNIRVGIGVNYASVGQSESDDKENTLIVAPSVFYYVPIAKNLYYTPGLTIGYVEKSGNSEYKDDLNGYVAGLSLLSFEYRYSDKFAVNLNIGSFQYSSLSYGDDDEKISFNTQTLDILSNASVGFSLYF